MKFNNDNTDYINYFINKNIITQRHFHLCRDYFVNKLSVPQLTAKYGYARTSIYDIIKNFRDKLDNNQEPFFLDIQAGQKNATFSNDTLMMIFRLRNQNLSVPEIKGRLEAKGLNISARKIYAILRHFYFPRLKKRSTSKK
ncbi:MAG: hypothetical protein LBT38_10995 [Deltaproteobacteria bacterium]|jgi:predicted DNA-binding protein YlxM (UPF0122 family)|nr:hypothetical protein [Deltaproteobacteria bacterium]